MEIFNAIWTALTTPNEFLIFIFSIPLIFVEALVSMLLFTSIFNLSYTKKQMWLYVLSTGTISLLLSYLIPNPYRSILSLLTIPVLIHLFFKTNFIKSIFSAIIPMIVIVILESIYMWIISHIFNITLYELTTIPSFRISFAIVTYLLMFLIYKIIKSFHIVLYIMDNIDLHTKIILFVYIIIGIITILMQFYLVGFYLKSLPLFVVIFSLLSLIAFFFLSIFTFAKVSKLEITKKDLAQEKEHNRILKLLQDDLRGFRHDFANIMCTIGGYIHVKDIDGLANYYSQIQPDINKINNLGALNPDTINNPAVFTLICAKYQKASDCNTTLNIECFLDLTKLNMKIYEFTRVLGILLDNAIEAAKECDEKVVYLELRKDLRSPRQLLIIKNTYKNKDVDTEKIFDKNYSTKPKNSGLGLWEVRQILKRNNNLNLFTTKNNDYFIQQLEMYD